MKRLALVVALALLAVLLMGAGTELDGQLKAAHGTAAFLNGTSWGQVNPDGFGDEKNQGVFAMGDFNGVVYAGTSNPNGAEIWRWQPTGWQQVASGGFGDVYNSGIDFLLAFNGYLYAGTLNFTDTASEGAQIWRSPTGNPGSWVKVVNGGSGTGTPDTDNTEFFHFFTRSSPAQICATTVGAITTHGAEIWCSANGTTWSKSVSNGFGHQDVSGIISSAAFGGKFYFGTLANAGGQVWRTDLDFSNPSQVNTTGFGSAANAVVTSLAVYEGYLYAATHHASGGGSEVWRCQVCSTPSDWVRVVENGFGDIHARRMPGLMVFRDKLFLVVGSITSQSPITSDGLQVWETDDGAAGTWRQDVSGGFNDIKNDSTYYGNSLLVSEDRFFIATNNMPDGGEVWEFLPEWLYLPLVIR